MKLIEFDCPSMLNIWNSHQDNWLVIYNDLWLSYTFLLLQHRCWCCQAFSIFSIFLIMSHSWMSDTGRQPEAVESGPHEVRIFWEPCLGCPPNLIIWYNLRSASHCFLLPQIAQVPVWMGPLRHSEGASNHIEMVSQSVQKCPSCAPCGNDWASEVCSAPSCTTTSSRISPADELNKVATYKHVGSFHELTSGMQWM